MDKYFHPVRPAWSPGLSTALNLANTIALGSTSVDLASVSSLFRSPGSTATQVTTQVTGEYAQVCHSSGEFGNVTIDSFSNSTATPPHGRTNEGRYGKAKLNLSVVNSDHVNQSLVYIQYGFELLAVDRITGDVRFPDKRTSSFTLDITGYGQCSYNAKRKELVQVSYFNTGSKGGRKVISYSNVDFNRYPSPAVALNRPEVVKKEVIITTINNWVTTDTDETKFNTNCVLCDDGGIYLSVYFTGSGLALFKINRNDNLDVSSVTYVGTKAVAAGGGKGIETDLRYGQRAQQSRDKQAVLLYAAYANYGAGLVSWGVDRTYSKVIPTTFAQKSITSNGVNVMPYGDDGFACYVAADVTLAVGANALVTNCYRGEDSNWIDSTNGLLLAYYPLPKTIYYPAMTQVVDYAMLINESLE